MIQLVNLMAPYLIKQTLYQVWCSFIKKMNDFFRLAALLLWDYIEATAILVL